MLLVTRVRNSPACTAGNRSVRHCKPIGFHTQARVSDPPLHRLRSAPQSLPTPTPPSAAGHRPAVHPHGLRGVRGVPDAGAVQPAGRRHGTRDDRARVHRPPGRRRRGAMRVPLAAIGTSGAPTITVLGFGMVFAVLTDVLVGAHPAGHVRHEPAGHGGLVGTGAAGALLRPVRHQGDRHARQRHSRETGPRPRGPTTASKVSVTHGRPTGDSLRRLLRGLGDRADSRGALMDDGAVVRLRGRAAGRGRVPRATSQ